MVNFKKILSSTALVSLVGLGNSFAGYKNIDSPESSEVIKVRIKMREDQPTEGNPTPDFTIISTTLVKTKSIPCIGLREEEAPETTQPLQHFTIEAGLNKSKTRVIKQVSDPGYEFWVKTQGSYNIPILKNCASISYDVSEHKFIVKNLAIKKLQAAMVERSEDQKSFPSHQKEFNFVKVENGWDLNFRTSYTQYGQGNAEYEPKYSHYFSAFIPKDVQEGATIEAKLKEIWYTPAHDGSFKRPDPRKIYL